jgi:hypothetical protein
MSEPAPLLLEAEAVTAAMASMFPDADGARHLAITPERVEHDIARLVLTLVEFLRRLLELQAIRRMEAGSLTPEQEEALGTTLMRARERVLELARQFELNEADLRLDLGPLGRLM